MKKIFVFITVLLILTGLIIGCASPATAPASSKPVPPTTGSTSAAPAIVPTTTSSASAAPAPATVSATIATPVKVTTGPKYGGIVKIIPAVSPGGPIGWPVEGIGEVFSTQQFALENLIVALRDGSYLPALATSWKISTDKPSITFNLRKGVKFHDGTDFNASAVKFNLQAVIDAKKSIAKYWTSIDAIDDYTVRVNLSKWENIQLLNFVNLATYMVSPTAFQKNGIEWMRLNIVGTGPFKFVSFTRDVNAKFVKNENYWDTGKPYLDGVELTYISDAITQKLSMQSGAASVLMNDVGKTSTDLAATGDFEAAMMSSGTMVLVPDSANANSPYADKRVRQAVQYAIDREDLMKAKGWGVFKPLYQLPPSDSPAYDPNYSGLRYNPQKAKQLLAEAGYANGFKSKIIVSTVGTDRDIAVATQAYLNQVGIAIELDIPDYAKFMEYRQKGWSNALIYQPTLVTSNYNQFLQSYFSSGTDWVSLKRPEGLLPMIDESLVTAEVDKGKVQKVLSLLYDESTLIPLNNTASGAIFRKNVHDFGFTGQYAAPRYLPGNGWLSQ